MPSIMLYMYVYGLKRKVTFSNLFQTDFKHVLKSGCICMCSVYYHFCVSAMGCEGQIHVTALTSGFFLLLSILS